MAICDRCGSNDRRPVRGGIFGYLCDPCYEVVPIVQIGALRLPGETWCHNCRRLRTKYEQRGAVLGWFPRACGSRLGCIELRGKEQPSNAVRSPEAAARFERLQGLMDRVGQADPEAIRPS